jgi:hypothetical protein
MQSAKIIANLTFFVKILRLSSSMLKNNFLVFTQRKFSGVDVMITNFCNFYQFSAKKWRFSQKPMLWSIFFKKLAVVWAKNANIFAKFFGENILKISTSVAVHLYTFFWNPIEIKLSLQRGFGFYLSLSSSWQQILFRLSIPQVQSVPSLKYELFNINLIAP